MPKGIFFHKKNCENKLPKSKIKPSMVENKLTGKIKDELKNLIDLVNNQDLNNYIKKVIEYSFDANKFFNDSEPWSLKTDSVKMNSILNTIVVQIKNISILLLPIIPASANKVLDMINYENEFRSISHIRKDNNFNYDKELGEIEISSRKLNNACRPSLSSRL